MFNVLLALQLLPGVKFLMAPRDTVITSGICREMGFGGRSPDEQGND
jgi:hypothetical protein